MTGRHPGHPYSGKAAWQGCPMLPVCKMCIFNGKAILLCSSYLFHLKIHVWVNLIHFPWTFIFLRSESWFIGPLIQLFIKLWIWSFKWVEKCSILVSFWILALVHTGWNLSILDPCWDLLLLLIMSFSHAAENMFETEMAIYIHTCNISVIW